MRGIIALCIFVSVIIGGFFAFRLYWYYEEQTIRSEFDYIALNGKPSGHLLGYSLICFNDNTGSEREDFSSAAKRAGHDLDKSLNACGVGARCCDLEMQSDLPCVIGFVRNGEVECIPIKKFIYVLEGANASCISPSRLKITKDTFKSKFHLRGRPWLAKAGDGYYKVEEKQ